MRAPPAKRSKQRTRRALVTKQDLRDNNPKIVDQTEARWLPRLKNWAIAVGAICTALVFLYQGYVWLGMPLFVNERGLDHAITNVKTEVNGKIDATKNEVVGNQNAIKGEITGTLGEVTKKLTDISKNQNASAMEAADMAMKLAFTQLQSLQGQMATWKQALAKNPNDASAQTRVLQLETFIRQNEKDMQDAKDKMTRLRNGQ